MIVVLLIFGDLVVEYYEDVFYVVYLLIDCLCEKMEIVEELCYSCEYLEVDKCFIVNVVEVFFDDGSSIGQVVVEYLFGYCCWCVEGILLLQEKFKVNLVMCFLLQCCQRIFDLCSYQVLLEVMLVNCFMDFLVI